MVERNGGCLCGAVRYVLLAEPRTTAICHCTHCQKQSGSLFSFNLVMRETEYEQTGETGVFVDTSDSGNAVERHFCKNCGSPIFALSAAAPGKLIVKAGTLDSMDDLRPQTEIYTDHAASWQTPFQKTTRYAKNFR